MRSTWYVLEDGTAVDPNDVAPDETGVLRHKTGTAVAMRGDAPSSRSVEVDEAGKQPFAGKGDHDHNGSTGGAAPAARAATREMNAQPPNKPYQTRGARTSGKKAR